MDPNSPAPVDDDSDDEDNDSASATPDQTQSPQQQPAVPVTQPLTPQQHGVNTAQELKLEDQNFQNDIDQGHITPQTMASMFQNKSLPGQIGTIFGMLMSGMGSGMAHQPNMLMELMQKQIDNDLDAQKTSAVNAQNAYRLSQAHQMQQAQIKQMDINNQLTQLQAAEVQAKTPAEVAEIKARASNLIATSKNLDAETATKSDALAQMRLNRAQLSIIKQNIDKMPDTIPGPNGQPIPNPQKQQALQTYGLMYNKTTDLNSTFADKAGMLSALNFSNNNPAQMQQAPSGKSNVVPYAPGQAPGQQQQQQQPLDPETAFQQKQAAYRRSGDPNLQQMAADNEAHHLTGFSHQTSTAVTDADRNYVNASQTFLTQLKKFRDWAATHSGDLHPSDKAYGISLAREVQNSYGQAKGYGVFNPESGDLISQNIDAEPTKFFNSIRVLPKLDAVKMDTNTKLGAYLQNKLGIPTKIKNGTVYYRDQDSGKAIPVKGQ
jgi:hypothetical protein